MPSLSAIGAVSVSAMRIATPAKCAAKRCVPCVRIGKDQIQSVSYAQERRKTMFDTVMLPLAIWGGLIPLGAFIGGIIWYIVSDRVEARNK